MRLNRDLNTIKNYQSQADANVIASTEKILADVKIHGDEAVRRYAKQFDGFTCEDIQVSIEEISAARRNIGPDLNRLLCRAYYRIEDYHRNQAEKSWSVYKDDGVVMGQIIRPLARVALYVPGGTAAYPSSVLMNAIPAKLAGVKDIAIFTPVKADGKVPEIILAAAAVCGIKTIYKIGGAHAIAAAAYGTASIPKVDKIVGPGNIYVATAKRMV
ncbi:MAG: histidinol dehydrogenase, partial [Defluviitaleaceae bacterium]|nr:histidinol dehydrogenase [Defluviitaleaceae bacterium]